MMTKESHEEKKDDFESRKGFIKTMIDHFSSTPIDPLSDLDRSSNASNRSLLTQSEREYLEHLLRSGDVASIESASQKLNDRELFPIDILEDTEEQEEPTVKRRRDSQVQQQLFRLHETKAVQPSRVLQRFSLIHGNSILESSDELEHDDDHHHNCDDDTEELNSLDQQGVDSYGHDWNLFKDVSSWLDGSQGVEVNDSGEPLAQKVCQPLFKILGTTADDISCHPHVLTPPLMESLLAFVPEALTEHNFWLKYSLVRDGSSMYKLLRQVRASANCFLAIESTDGNVIGAFTSQSWRLSQGWYGNKDAFLWKMRRSRSENKRSILEQVVQEAEIQVFPFRPGNVAVQCCSKDGIMMGQGELLPAIKPGKHYGHALYLDPDLRTGTSSTSETFGNPCLVDADQRGAKFEVSNIEVWALTPHHSVTAAEQSELSALFLEGGRTGTNLRLIDVLVGGPI